VSVSRSVRSASQLRPNGPASQILVAVMAVKDLCRRHGFSEASYYLRRGKYGGMGVSDVTVSR
jgi:hypothetical protein